MSTRSVSRRLRIPLSRGLALALAIVILCSSSYWDGISIAGDVFFLAGCVLVGIGTLGRLWCTLFVAGYKSRSLVTVGPYSICRNPLYFFSLLGAVGIGLAARSLLIPAVVLVLFAVYYPIVIRSEQRRLLSLHGDDFLDYQRRTPAFLPRWSLFKEPESYAVNPRLYRKHMFSALWFIWLLGVLEVVRACHQAGLLPVWFRIY
ncbi:MAG: isoprenylcysteine carboxylmethyltransferase family protein [Pirellulales bacterium]|nr:isoprenylcysteine carboxylmethyltransferase family protein [Pirellulales bacterium]